MEQSKIIDTLETYHLPWRAIVTGKDLAGGLVAFLSKDPGEGRRLLILI